MSIEKEINRAVNKIAAVNEKNAPKTPEEQAQIIASVEDALRNSTYNFSMATPIILKQDGKKRLVKQYKDIYSPENILCQCIKQILDKAFKVKYPNRVKISHNLFCILPATIQMADFTIVKFDFKNYFNSISTIYVFEKYIKGNLSDRREIDLIKAFAYSTKYAYAGLCTSNTIAEIIATYFDEAIRQVFTENGLILYERYVDDCVLILNEHMEETEVNNTLNAILFDIFHDSQLSCNMCKTKFNIQKFCYISRRKVLADNHAISIDFLGYEFWLASRQQKNKVIITIQYGVTEAKRKKYSDRLDDLISYYAKRETDNADFNDLELLRHRIAAFSSREVYLSKHFRSNIWRVKGFISNYGELRFFLDTDLIEANTKSFLKNAIDDAFARANIKKPYFLLGGGYNLFDNMRTNKTILLVNHIGYDYNALSALCRQIGINSTDRNGKPRGYGNLVRDYLIKVRVGY